MLDSHYEALALAEGSALLECEIELPASWGNFFVETGMLPTTAQERRRFPRHRFRTPAAMKIVQGLPNLHRPDAWYKVYAKDVSRGGLSFLHSEQMFPGERVQLAMANGHQYIAEIRRSRRIGKKCYVIGVRFVEALSSLGETGDK